VINHCKELRKIPELANAHFVIGVESNGNGTERQHQRWHIESSSLKNKTVLREAGGKGTTTKGEIRLHSWSPAEGATQAPPARLRGPPATASGVPQAPEDLKRKLQNRLELFTPCNITLSRITLPVGIITHNLQPFLKIIFKKACFLRADSVRLISR